MQGDGLGGDGVGCGNRRAKGHLAYHHARSYRRKLLDGLVASLALTPIPAKKLLNFPKVTLTLTPGLIQTLNRNLDLSP